MEVRWIIKCAQENVVAVFIGAPILAKSCV